jgi:hypothetical protein
MKNEDLLTGEALDCGQEWNRKQWQLMQQDFYLQLTLSKSLPHYSDEKINNVPEGDATLPGER